MSYSSNQSKKELNYQLLVGIKKHLLIAQDTSLPKSQRMQSLQNMQEVIEFVLHDMNSAIPPDEIAIYKKFFNLLIVKIGTAKIQLHQQPVNFSDEISFITLLTKM